MTPNTREALEECFLQGVAAGEGGLSREVCPYEYSQPGEQNIDLSRINWEQGWAFGKFRALQKLRRELKGQIRQALQKLLAHETEFAALCETVNKGLLEAGLGYLRAQRKLNVLMASICSSKEYKLLEDLRIELYFACRPAELPYGFRVFDRQLAVFGYDGGEGPLRKLVERYGERYGVKAAWSEYVYSEPVSGL